MTKQPNTDTRFSELGIAPGLLAELAKQKLVKPTPIQEQCIPAALEEKDVVGIAQTGTGKTLAFGLPMLQALARSGGQGLIVLPTRELAIQVDEMLNKVGRSFNLKTAVLIGGEKPFKQLQALKRKPHIIIATPGRLIDFMGQKKVKLDQVKVVVLDEADRMLDIGFMPQIKEIMKSVPKQRQTLLFSATMPNEIAEIAAHYMKMPIRIEVAPSGTTAKNVEQELFVVSKPNKMEFLEKILNKNQGSVLIFSRTKYGAKKIAASLRKLNHRAIEIHSNRTLAQRKDALEGFKSGKYRIMVATDVASRGLDINDISLVINFDLPEQAEDYVHRIGRTGRADKFGRAISFATPDQRTDIRQIEKLIKKTIPVLSLPGMPVSPAMMQASHTKRKQSRHKPYRKTYRRVSRRRR
ncbi:DEAD/DEAH box helicase [Patescibacteria group bacterium]|nr:DEAD/DEAH box helicase [Patescibacteria group bacterium]MBU1673821.1 DEAD/DEAH box helicase [Patescibacteria group bacterium]MBU1964068.1 DEAD/DEAH box helicase [Patescibacteria group bacterium]